MKNRPRPPIPLTVKLTVALRDLGEMPATEIGSYIEFIRRQRRLKPRLSQVLASLAVKLRCDVSDLRLDHEPALRVRAYNSRIADVAARYTPNANDPACMNYRPHGAEFDRSHHVKTNVRGDHGQFPDRVLIKRERRRENRTSEKHPKLGSKKRKYPRSRMSARPVTIPTRANPWPPKGARPFRGRNR